MTRLNRAFLASPRVDVHSKLLHVITTDSNGRHHSNGACALGIMLGALERAETDARGLRDGIADNFNGRLAHNLLRAAGFDVTPELRERIR